MERNIANLYEARRLLLGLDSCEVSVATKTSCEVSIVPKPAMDSLLVNGGMTNYWLNMLMQQLHVTETGVCVCFKCSFVYIMLENSILSIKLTYFYLWCLGTVNTPDSISNPVPVKPRPSPPPGLTALAEESRMGLRGTDTKLEKV